MHMRIVFTDAMSNILLTVSNGMRYKNKICNYNIIHSIF